jgi:hypothetical protein
VDGYISHAWTYVDWIAEQQRHLIANQREIPPTLEADMQEQLCLTLPEGWCLYDDPRRRRPLTSISFSDVAAGLKTFAKWIAGGMKYVEAAEAERRALICTRCYLNVNIEGCSGCKQAVEETIGDRKTKVDGALRACAVCKCFLRAKVHFPLDTLDTQSDKVQEMYPGFCWLNKESVNYRG